MRISFRAALACSLVWACASTPELDEKRVVDLTHAFDDATVQLPIDPPFSYQRSRWGRDEMGRWFASGQFSMSEHGGTHMCAPSHLAEGLRTVNEIPISQLIAPIRVIDVQKECRKNTDYLITPDDLANHEQAHGRVPIGAAVIVRTGWERYWDNPRRYLGGGEDGRMDNLHFPGLSLELARELVQRHVDLVAIDGPGIDNGPSTEFAAQRALAEANIPVLANLTGLAELPAFGATLIALPMKIASGTGAPARVVALVP